jgi:hypothetical protein
MQKIVVIETRELDLFYYEDKKILHHVLHRYPGVTKMEQALEAGLEVLNDRRAQKWLSDNRNGAAWPKSHHEWAETSWGPRAAKAGWRYWALIPPTELLGQQSMLRMVKIYGALGVTVRVFERVDEGLGWLANAPEVSSP